MNEILQEDSIRIAGASCIGWERLEGKTVLITGATGLLGTQLVLALDQHCRTGGSMRILAFCRSREKAMARFGECTEHVEIVTGDVTETLRIDGPVDHIVHGAAVTGSRDFVEKPVETIASVLKGTENLLALAREKEAESFVFLSSLEIYGSTDPEKPSVKEEEPGRLDPMRVRSSYPEAKRMAECMCAAWHSEYGVPARVVRLCQTFGPGVDYHDGRVFAEFARAVIERRDIVLRSRGETFRNYCYTADAAAGILTVLTRGADGEAYNLANPSTGISIADMARMAAQKLAGGEIAVRYDLSEDPEKLGYAPKVVIRLDPSRAEALGWRAETGLEEAFERMIRYMRGT